MGKEALAQFLAAMAEDATLQEELRQAAEGEGQQATVSVDRMVEVAAARGFDFSVEEALGVFELGDDELDAVAGGLQPPSAVLFKSYKETFFNAVKPVPGSQALPLDQLIGLKGAKY